MKWMQFLTPVKSISTQEAEAMMAKAPGGDIVLLDVRQPGEYEASHIPGALLVPLPELTSNYHRIDPGKPVLVY